ncbi:protein FANTASTIC FOUR 3-like [Vigna unguiculata]|uniref:protein FANTASTIC FOUR 3-like n=1 Tax=Vigna unguiculata TaxID=3917 RepID=UPI001016E4E9|nr:protein FANTASTIC FOUR 3-like [Vigna unguiculata]
MAATLCHSYMESQLMESTIHRLMLSSPKPVPPPQKSIDLPFKSNNQAYANWTNIQALSTAPKEITSVDTYLKPSSLRLSPKSLELCTENLGNETGSDIIESGIELLSSHSSECGEGEVGVAMIREKQKRKAREGRSFPPPLTTITGSETIRVRPHREGGRLVLQLTKVPSSFRAERSPGRLRLCFWTEMQHHHHHHHIEDAVEDDHEDEVEKTQEHQHDDDDDDVDDDDDDGVDAVNNECEWERFQEHRKERKSWGVEGVVRVESTMFEWPSSRCKEEEHENINDLLMYWGEPVRLISI